MWKEANCRGRRWQWKYQNQGTYEAHCKRKGKEGIFKIDLFCLFFFPLKRFVTYFCSLIYRQGSWSRIHDVTCQTCTSFQLVFNGLVGSMALMGGKG